MKQIILGLLFAALASPAMGQALEDFYSRGQKDAFLTCYLISQGYTSGAQINNAIMESLDPAQKMIIEIVFYQLNKKESDEEKVPALAAYVKGFSESIQICESEFNKLTD